MTRRGLWWTAALCCVVGAALAASDLVLRAKGAVAARLIDRALERHETDGAVHRPWSWADMHPIGRLEMNRLGVSEPVLSDASGESMAFGIGHVTGTAPPNTPGNCVLAGHRSSSMAWLGDARLGDVLVLSSKLGRKTYRIRSQDIIDSRDPGLVLVDDEARLSLVTCYPLNGLLPGPRRLVVVAEPWPPTR